MGPDSPYCRAARAAFTHGIVLALLIFQGCGKKPEAPAWPDGALAQVGEVYIQQDDLDREADYRRSKNRPVPNDEALLTELVEAEALKQKAARDGFASSYETARELDNILVTKWKDHQFKNLAEQVKVTDEDVRAYYDAHIDEYAQPARIRVSLLRLKMPKNASDETRAGLRGKMEEALQKAQAMPAVTGKRKTLVRGFDRLSTDYSDEATSRYRGGDIGWLAEGQLSPRWPEALIKTAFSLETGAISEVLELADGFYLVRKTDERPAVVKPFEEMASAIKKGLETRKLVELRNQLVHSAVDEVGVTYPEGSSDQEQSSVNAAHILPGAERAAAAQNGIN